MESVFLVCFFTGVFFAVVSAFLAGLSGGGGHHAGTGVGDTDLGDVDVGDVDLGDVDVSHDFDMGHDFDHSLAEAGGDGHVEVGVGDSFPGLSPWSPTVLSSFVAAFGGVGYLTLTNGWWGGGTPLSLLFALSGGLLVSAGVFFGMNRLFAALQSSSDVLVADLIGETAEVLTPIPENGVGEIAYNASGTRLTAPARTLSGKPVGRAALVEIVRIAGNVYYVKPR